MDSSRGTSTQTIVNNVNNITEECKTEMMDNDSETDSDRNSVHSNWSELRKKPRKRAIKNIVLVPYKLKPKDWGSWKVKSPYVTSTIASPPLNLNDQNQNNEEMVYVPHSLYYTPVHPAEFYGDE